MKKQFRFLVFAIVLSSCLAIMPILDSGRAESVTPALTMTYPIVDTGQSLCYDDEGRIAAPKKGSAFYGQDAQYDGVQFSYRNNGDGTVTDLNTGLIWQQNFAPQTLNFEDAKDYAEDLELAGHDDWRLPTMKELYSLAAFWGSIRSMTPYLDTDTFGFEYPDTSTGARIIDAQYWSSNLYVGTTMNNDESAFGFNFADGRIKSYPITKLNYIRCVRGGNGYGENDFVNNGDGTITDRATGLMWMKRDSSETMNWEDALSYAENLTQAGHSDWRLPNAKELQSIVDYSCAPDAKNASNRRAAIDTIFSLTETESWFWTCTTLGEDITSAVYICFGQAFAATTDHSGNKINAHGAGAQRSDPKSGDPSDYAGGRGPQADEIRIFNYVRCVRDASATSDAKPIDLASTRTKVTKDAVDAGSSVTAKALIRNRGDDKSTVTTVSFYLSSRKRIDSVATFLGEARIKSLTAGKQKWVRLKAELSGQYDTGSYYILSYVDEANKNDDTKTSNNTSYTSVTIM